MNDFEAMCVECHGRPGKKPAAVGQGLNPVPPDLADVATRRSAAELFWVTKHGIRMTGMPAWGATHDDEALWPVVAVMSALPGMEPADYAALLEDAKGMGHHGPGPEDDVGASEHAEDQLAPPVEQSSDDAEHDHSSHEH
jgi:hypothetical protein